MDTQRVGCVFVYTFVVMCATVTGHWIGYTDGVTENKNGPKALSQLLEIQTPNSAPGRLPLRQRFNRLFSKRQPLGGPTDSDDEILEEEKITINQNPPPTLWQGLLRFCQFEPASSLLLCNVVTNYFHDPATAAMLGAMSTFRQHEGFQENQLGENRMTKKSNFWQPLGAPGYFGSDTSGSKQGNAGTGAKPTFRWG
ncbi:uncharacterized protein LOC106176062 [Lingula anatina]|uniref:Uncharacterized protein LOC106176062 n=1 Tax=Lingula anatina TaxID=7574 RepID=A0A1S3JUF9_LINAN|nr:uncharacterized protein LOC106176062 [Lingula anatina]|eukprot:XP_013413731.1 uncharacterized protein LOC106176062 [Lingula anatina]